MSGQAELVRLVRQWIQKAENDLKNAEHTLTMVEDFVNQAVRERLEQLEAQRLEAEAQAFERTHPQLVKQYLGQFVAVHEGQVVDADADFETLFLRLQKRLGDVLVLIRPVSTELTLELRAPGPRLERSAG